MMKKRSSSIDKSPSTFSIPRGFAEVSKELKKVSQTVKQFEVFPVSQIPWGHNVILVTKIKDSKEPKKRVN